MYFCSGWFGSPGIMYSNWPSRIVGFDYSFILAALFFVGGIQALLAGINIAVYSAVLGYGEAG